MARAAANQRGSRDRGGALGKEYADYMVRDPAGRKIGRVKECFTNVRDEPKYVRAKTGFLGLKTFLIPIGFVAVEEERRPLTLQ